MVARSAVGLNVRAGFLHYAERAQSSATRGSFLSRATICTLTLPANIALSTAYLSFFATATATDALASLIFRALPYTTCIASLETTNRLRDRAQLHFDSMCYGLNAISSIFPSISPYYLLPPQWLSVLIIAALSACPLIAQLFKVDNPNDRYQALPPPLPFAYNRALARAEAFGQLERWDHLNPVSVVTHIDRERLQYAIAWALRQPNLASLREDIQEFIAFVNVAQLYVLQVYIHQGEPSLRDLPAPILQALQEACFLGPGHMDPFIAAPQPEALRARIRAAKTFLQTAINPRGTSLARDNGPEGFIQTYRQIAQHLPA